MFTLRNESVAEDERSRVDVHYVETPQSVSDFTGFEQQARMNQVSTIQTVVDKDTGCKLEGQQYDTRYVSILPAVDKNSVYSGPEVVQKSPEQIACSAPVMNGESSTSLQSAFMPCQTQGVEYVLSTQGVSMANGPQYFIIGSSLFNQSQVNSSTILLTSKASTGTLQVPANVNSEIIDAVANITEETNNIEQSVDFISPAQTFIVSTNSLGEIKHIHILNESETFENSSSSSNYCQESSDETQEISKSERKLFQRLKENNFSVKKFSLEELDSTGTKSRQQLFEEYLNQLQEKAGRKKNKENSQPESCTGRTTPGSDEFDNEGQLTYQENPDRKGNILESQKENELPNTDDRINEMQTSSEDLGNDFTFDNAENKTRVKNEDKQVMDKNLEFSHKSTPKRRGKHLHVHEAVSRKKSKLLETGELSGKSKLGFPSEDMFITDSRMDDMCCRWFTKDDCVVLRLQPVTLECFRTKDKLVIEIDVSKEIKFDAVEENSLDTELKRYSLTIKKPGKSYSSDKVDTPVTGTCTSPVSEKCSDKTTKLSLNMTKSDLNLEKTRLQERRSPRKQKQTYRRVTRSAKKDSSMAKNVGSQIEADSLKEIKLPLKDLEVNKDDLDQVCSEIEDDNNTPPYSKEICKVEDGTVNEKVKHTKVVENSEFIESQSDSAACGTVSREITENETNSSVTAKKKKFSGRKRSCKEEENEKATEGKKNKQKEGYIEKRNDEGDRIFACETCGYISKYEHNTRKHVQQHTATSDWVCEECGLRLKSKHYLQKHRIVHQSDRPFTCPLCPQTFKRRRCYQCQLCGKESSNRQNMDVHLNQHTDRRPWQCEVCGLGFRGPSNLRAHKHQHENILRFSCPVCGKKFRDRGTHSQHMKRHVGDKQHVCEHCGKTFVITSDLKKHIRTHTQEKPFHCQVCGREFSDGSSFVRHVKIHAAKYRYECSVCKRNYSRRDLCNKHIKLSHAEMNQVDVRQISIEENKTSLPRTDTRDSQNRTKSDDTLTSHEAGHRPVVPPKKSFKRLTEVASDRYKEPLPQVPLGTSHYLHPLCGSTVAET